MDSIWKPVHLRRTLCTKPLSRQLSSPNTSPPGASIRSEKWWKSYFTKYVGIVLFVVYPVIALGVRRVFSLLRLNIATICACNPYEFRSRTNMKDCQSPVARSNGNEFITLLAATSGGLRGVHAWEHTRGRKLALSVRMNTVRICTMTVYCWSRYHFTDNQNWMRKIFQMGFLPFFLL